MAMAGLAMALTATATMVGSVVGVVAAVDLVEVVEVVEVVAAAGVVGVAVEVTVTAEAMGVMEGEAAAEVADSQL